MENYTLVECIHATIFSGANSRRFILTEYFNIRMETGRVCHKKCCEWKIRRLTTATAHKIILKNL